MTFDTGWILVLLVLASVPLSALAISALVGKRRSIVNAYAAILPLTALALPEQFGSADAYLSYLVFAPFAILSMGLLLTVLVGGRRIGLGRRIAIRKGPLFYPFMFFLAAIAVSVIASGEPSGGIGVILSWALIFLLYLSIYNVVRSASEVDGFVQAFILATAMLSLIGGFWWITGDTTKGINPFGVGILESNHFAFLLQQSLFLCVALASFRGQPFSDRGRYAACAVLAALFLMLTFSRGAWVSSLVTAFGFIGVRLLSRTPRSIVMGVGVGALCAAGAAVAVPVIRIGLWGLLSPIASSPSRLEMEATAWRVFIGHPVFGVGPHNFSTYVEAVSRQIIGSADLYSRTLGELGAVGFLTFCFLMARIATAIAAGMRSAPEDSIRRSLQLGFLLGFLSNAVDFLFFGLIFPFPWLFYFVGVASAHVPGLAEHQGPRTRGRPGNSVPQVAMGG